MRLLHGDRKQLSCRRRNLLRAAHPEDRARLLTLVVWERQLELRVARSFLLQLYPCTCPCPYPCPYPYPCLLA